MKGGGDTTSVSPALPMRFPLATGIAKHTVIGQK